MSPQQLCWVMLSYVWMLLGLPENSSLCSCAVADPLSSLIPWWCRRMQEEPGSWLSSLCFQRQGVLKAGVRLVPELFVPWPCEQDTPVCLCCPQPCQSAALQREEKMTKTGEKNRKPSYLLTWGGKFHSGPVIEAMIHAFNTTDIECMQMQIPSDKPTIWIPLDRFLGSLWYWECCHHYKAVTENKISAVVVSHGHWEMR